MWTFKIIEWILTICTEILNLPIFAFVSDEILSQTEKQRYDGWFNNMAHPEWGAVGKSTHLHPFETRSLIRRDRSRQRYMHAIMVHALNFNISRIESRFLCVSTIGFSCCCCCCCHSHWYLSNWSISYTRAYSYKQCAHTRAHRCAKRVTFVSEVICIPFRIQ